MGPTMGLDAILMTSSYVLDCGRESGKRRRTEACLQQLLFRSDASPSTRRA